MYIVQAALYLHVHLGLVPTRDLCQLALKEGTFIQFKVFISGRLKLFDKMGFFYIQSEIRSNINYFESIIAG